MDSISIKDTKIRDEMTGIQHMETANFKPLRQVLLKHLFEKVENVYFKLFLRSMLSLERQQVA